MDIDERDIEKGQLPEILPKFYPNSISYLSELNDYRMYAEVWSNKKSEANAKRMEIGHAGYLRTLEFGEQKKKRKSDKIRFDYFVAADSLDYMLAGNVYGGQSTYIQMGGAQTNNIFKLKTSSKSQSLHSDSDFHAEGYVPEILKLELDKLDLSQDAKINKHYFEISTNLNSISNQNQKGLLLRILGRDDLFEKMHLLHKVGRKHIRCLFEDPETVVKSMGRSSAVSRLCVAWPFQETLVFDFAGVPEDYSDPCLLGTLIKTEEKKDKMQKATTNGTGWHGGPLIDSYA